MTRPELVSVAELESLDAKTASRWLGEYQNPGQLQFLKLLGFDRVVIRRAEGVHYFDAEGRAILDFFGGFGSLGLGHNHPRILAVRRRFAEARRPEIQLAFASPYAVGLAKNLATIFPGDLDMVWLGCTGSEAVEYALKLAERANAPRSGVAYVSGSFHGKTRGALSVTDSPSSRAEFRLLDHAVCVPFGDADALEKVLATNRSIGSFIVEPIQGAAGIVPSPPGYLRAVRESCDRHGVVMICDEIQCGMGRTGRLNAFEHDGVVPDVVTIAKSLGGGKASISAVVCRRTIHEKAYGTRDTAFIHGPVTFSGMGEACATAIEALHVLYDQDLMANATRLGTYLLRELRRLAQKYPSAIREVRGRGLMVGIELATWPAYAAGVDSGVLKDALEGSLAGMIGALLLHEHGVLVAFTDYDRNVLRLEPPLIIEARHVEKVIESIESLLSRGPARLALDYARLVLGG